MKIEFWKTCVCHFELDSFPVLDFFFFFPIRSVVVFFFFLNLIYFLAVLGLHCCTQAFSSCSEQGLLFVAVHRFLTAVASLAAEYGL